jgi:hypothetical protein
MGGQRGEPLSVRWIAVTLPDRPPWWQVDLDAERLGHEFRRHLDPVQAVRLQLGVAIARLAEGNVSGHPSPQVS